MFTRRIALGALLSSFAAYLASAGATGGVALAAEEKEYKPRAESITHVQETLPGDESKTVVIKEFEFPPGFAGARHYHPGAVYVYVLEGEFTIDVEGREPQTIKAGTLYKEPLGRTMQARNASTSESTRVLVFQVGESGKPMMIKTE